MPKLAIAVAAALLLAAGAAQARPEWPISNNTVETNGLTSNALNPNGLDPTGLAGTAPASEGVSLGELSGVRVEAVILPDPRR